MQGDDDFFLEDLRMKVPGRQVDPVLVKRPFRPLGSVMELGSLGSRSGRADARGIVDLRHCSVLRTAVAGQGHPRPLRARAYLVGDETGQARDHATRPPL